MKNQDLIQEMEVLEGTINQEKYLQIKQILSTFPAQLRGKSNADLQLSASGLVSSDNRFFFIEHPYQKEWLLPAGHVELDEQPLEAACREFHEETGFFAHGNRLVDVNLIDIPFNAVKNEKAHQHIDFRYLLDLDTKAPSTAELPYQLLTVEDAPDEFKDYFVLLID
ncbi:NUDIX domain-containing protein [Lactococcus sp.]|uniref:NUDIX domain-containing protein n=1 Tax=Lactococcus sp. TaxID=44273 RepID=UPI0035B0D4EA